MVNVKILVEFECDFKYWRLLPSIDLNMYSGGIVEIGWLFIVAYIRMPE